MSSEYLVLCIVGVTIEEQIDAHQEDTDKLRHGGYVLTRLGTGFCKRKEGYAATEHHDRYILVPWIRSAV